MNRVFIVSRRYRWSHLCKQSDQGFPHPTPKGEKERDAAALGPPRHALSLPFLPQQASLS